MAHMQPIAEHFAAYHVETNEGTTVVLEDDSGVIVDSENMDAVAHAFRDYLAPRATIYSFERKEGWYGRLSASGYLDCTDWHGPYATADEALDAVKEQYDVD